MLIPGLEWSTLVSDDDKGAHRSGLQHLCVLMCLHKRWKITDVTSGSRLSRGAETSSCDGITRSLVLTVAHPSAAESIGALFAHWEGREGGGGRRERFPNEAKRLRPRRHVRVISSDLTDLCGSEPRGTPEDRCTGLTRGDRRLRWCSRTAAGTAGRGDREDRLRTRDSTEMYDNCTRGSGLVLSSVKLLGSTGIAELKLAPTLTYKMSTN